MKSVIKKFSILLVALIATISYGQDKELPVPAEYPFGNPKDDSRGIFGDDDRYEVSDVSGIEDYTRATAVMIPKESVYGTSLYGVTLRDRLSFQFGTDNMDKNVKFLDQPTIAGCSGFLVAPDIMVSAGHCILTNEDAKAFYWLFDYTTNLKSSEDGYFIEFDPDNLYEINEVLEGKLEGEGEYQKDYVVMRLDRKVKDRKPYRIRTSGKPANEASVYTIGAPTGLPLKVALNSEVVENTPEQWFKTDIDAFPGNSGGPVFDPNGFIEGILVRGAVEYANGSYTGDYKYDADCDCVKTVTFKNADYNAGCQIQKINRIPNEIIEKIITENLVHSIVNFEFEEYERWSVYEWMIPGKDKLAQDSFEALIIRTDVGQGLATGKNDIMIDLISRNSGKYDEGFEHDLVTYNLKTYSRDLRDATAEYLNLDARSTEGRTPLMDQAIYGNWGTADELLDYGANPALKDSSGNTALHLSVQSRNTEVVELIAKSTKDPNTINGIGDTALHLAARKGSTDMVIALINDGASAKIKNDDGYYPEKVAKKAGYKSLSKYLKKERKKK